MSSAADIGANASSYVGDKNLGGGSFGSFQLDLKPIEDLARYTMLYNLKEYEQRQKDAEAAAKEIADLTSYDLVNGIPKFSKQIQEKYDQLTAYVRDNPNALDYRNKKEWAEYKKMRGDLANDIMGAKENEIIFKLRQKGVQDETNPAEKERRQKKLDADIGALSIRDRLKHDDQFDVEPVVVGPAPIKEVQNTDIGRNFTGQATTQLPDMRIARSTASSVASGLLKISSEKGKFGDQYEAATASGKLEPVLSSQAFNAALQQYKNDPKYLDANGKLDIDKLIGLNDTIISPNLRNVKAFNENMRAIKASINGKQFKDNFNKELQFSNDASGLLESDYNEIDINDANGYSPDELVLTQMLAKTPGMSRTIKLDQTNLASTANAQRIQEKNVNLDYKASLKSLGLGYSQLEFQKLKDGWTSDGKKLVPPKPGATATTGVGGVVPYWENYISPQITSKDLLKNKRVTESGKVKDASGKNLPSNFSGDIPIEPKDISGLSMALLGEITVDGKQVGFTKDSNPLVRYQNGAPVGVVIDGVFYDQNDINSKATEAENKSVTNKFDKTLFQGGQPQGALTTETDAEYYKRTGQFRQK